MVTRWEGHLYRNILSFCLDDSPGAPALSCSKCQDVPFDAQDRCFTCLGSLGFPWFPSLSLESQDAGQVNDSARGMSIMRRSRCMVMTMAAACLMVLLGCDDEETTGTYLECSSFNKSGVSPVTDAATCREACVTAEGLVEVGGSLEDWSGSSGSGKCACYEGTNGYGGFETVCQDSSYSR